MKINWKKIINTAEVIIQALKDITLNKKRK
jgi:hypothetical protein